jgi:hypothetical protein
MGKRYNGYVVIMSGDPYNLQMVERTNLYITDEKMQEYIQEAKEKGIPIQETNYSFFKRHEVRIGKCRFIKDIVNKYYDMFEIENGGITHLITLDGDEPELVMAAKYTCDGDFIQMSYEGDIWRWVFTNGELEIIYPTLRWSMPKKRKPNEPTP